MGGYAWAEVEGRDNAYGSTSHINSTSNYDDEQDEASNILSELLKLPTESENTRNLILPVVFGDEPLCNNIGRHSPILPKVRRLSDIIVDETGMIIISSQYLLKVGDGNWFEPRPSLE